MYFCQVFTVQVFHVHAQGFFMFSISSPSLGQFLVLPCFVQLKPAFNKWLTVS